MSYQQSTLPPEEVSPQMMVRTGQIICGALMMGVLMFTLVVCVMRFGSAGQQVDQPADQPRAESLLLPGVAAAFAAILLVVRMVVLPSVVRDGLKQTAARKPIEELRKIDLYGVYQTRMIVGCAMLEGAAFLNIIAFLMAGQIWTLGIVGLLLALMALMFPTIDKVDSWADEQLRQLRLDPPRAT